MAPTWTHLIRFIAVEDGHEHLGQIDASATPDVGLALHEGKKVQAKVVTGTIFDGTVTDKVFHVQTVGTNPRPSFRRERAKAPPC